MTEARDRPAIRRELEWDRHSLFAGQAGAPWWAAISLALVITAAGALIDFQRIGRLGMIFQACYFLGCLLAVIAVQRKALFGPMVQPPLLLALAVPGMILLTGSRPSGGLTATALAVGTPLINGFPTMAITTGVTLAIGTFRLVTQRRLAEPRPPSPSPKGKGTPSPGPKPTAKPAPRATKPGTTASKPVRNTKGNTKARDLSPKPRDLSPPRTRSGRLPGQSAPWELAADGPPTDPAVDYRRPS